MIIHLVGAQQSNHPWGFENRLISAIQTLGHTLISTDFRQEGANLPKLLQQKADLILVCKGENIDPHLIESCPCVTALWYAEQLGTAKQCDKTALGRRIELAFNIHSFDYVFSHDPANLLVYKRLGAEKVFALPCAAVDPEINRKIDVPKKYDVVFVGSKTPRRQALLEELSRKGIKIHSPNIWDAHELNRLFNESRIVLNFHLSDLLNTETRVAEVLGSGSFLLSENLSDTELVEDGKHFCSVVTGNVSETTEKIRYYLTHENEREKIAYQGHQYILENHTHAHRIQKILDTVDFSLNRRIWPSYILGVPANRRMMPTLRLDRYNSSVEELLTNVFKLGPDFHYSQEWYDNEYHTERLGLDVRIFDEIRVQYEKMPYYKKFCNMLETVDIPSTNLNWLEVGCHVGLTAYWAASKFPNAHLYMFDFSKTPINWLKKEFPFPERATIWQASVEDIKLPDSDLAESMDVVTCLDVTEHLPDGIYKHMITEIHRVMKPGAILILSQGTAPNEEHIHILPEEQIDHDFLSADFEKLSSPHPQWHYFKKRIEPTCSKMSEMYSTQVPITTESSPDYISSYNLGAKKLSEDENLDIAFRFADTLIPHSAWSISKNALKLLIEKAGHEITGILECGAGYSTLFFAKWMALNNKNIPIHSFEHNAVFWNKLSKDLQPFPNVNLVMPKLKQLSDYEYGELFVSKSPSDIYRDMGHPVPIELYHQTRLHNVFYDIEADKFKLYNVNLIIIDGPNGNGRSIAFPLLRDLVRLPIYCLVDDFTHYPFLEEMQKCFEFLKIFEFDYGHDAYSFMKITKSK
jgi:spore maturation protein CgeB